MNFKKVLALVLVFTMCLSMIPSFAFADFEDEVLLEDEADVEVPEYVEPEDVYIDEEPVVEPVAVPEDNGAADEILDEEPAQEPAPEAAKTAEAAEAGDVTDTAEFEAPNVNVAMIDAYGFTTLKEAVEYAGETIEGVTYGKEVKLILPVNLQEELTLNKELTLTTVDKANNVLTGDLKVEAGANVTLKGLTVKGNVTVNADVISMDNVEITGTLTINGGEVTLATATNVIKNANPSILINGGKVTISAGDFGIASAGTNLGANPECHITGGKYVTIDKALIADGYVTTSGDNVTEADVTAFNDSTNYLVGTVAKADNVKAMAGAGAARKYYTTAGEAFNATKVNAEMDGEIVTLLATPTDISTESKYTMALGQKLRVTKNIYSQGIYNWLTGEGGLQPVVVEEESSDSLIVYKVPAIIAYIGDQNFSSLAAAVASATDATTSPDAIIEMVTAPEEGDVAYLEPAQSVNVHIATPSDALAYNKLPIKAKGTNLNFGIVTTVTYKDGSTTEIKYVTYTCEQAIARIGSTTYANLVDALEVVQADQTIELLGDAALSDALTTTGMDFEFYIDLGKNTLFMSDEVEIAEKTTLNVSNGTVKLATATSMNGFKGNGTLNLENLTITGEGVKCFSSVKTLNIIESVVTIEAYEDAGSAVFFGSVADTNNAVVIGEGSIINLTASTTNGYNAFSNINSLTIKDSTVNAESVNFLFTDVKSALIDESAVTVTKGMGTAVYAQTVNSLVELDGATAKLDITLATKTDAFGEAPSGTGATEHKTLGVKADPSALTNTSGLITRVGDTMYCKFESAARMAIEAWELADKDMPVITLINKPEENDVVELKLIGSKNTYEYVIVDVNGVIEPIDAIKLATVTDTAAAAGKAIKATAKDASQPNVMTIEVGTKAVAVMAYQDSTGTGGKKWNSSDAFTTVEEALASAYYTGAGNVKYIAITETMPYVFTATNTDFNLKAVGDGVEFVPSIGTATDLLGYSIQAESVKLATGTSVEVDATHYYLKKDQITITFNPNGGEWPDMAGVTPDKDGNIVRTGDYNTTFNVTDLPEDPSKTDMALKGWFDATEGGTQYKAGTLTDAEKKAGVKTIDYTHGNLTLYAQYEQAVASLTDKGGNTLYYTSIEDAVTILKADGQRPAEEQWFAANTYVKLLVDATYDAQKGDLDIDLNGHELSITPVNRNGETSETSFTTASPTDLQFGKITTDANGISHVSMSTYAAEVHAETYRPVGQHTTTDAAYAKVEGSDVFTLYDTFAHAADAAISNGTTDHKTVVMMATDSDAYVLTDNKLGTNKLVVEDKYATTNTPVMFNITNGTGTWAGSYDAAKHQFTYAITKDVKVVTLDLNYPDGDLGTRTFSVATGTSLATPTDAINDENLVLGKKIDKWFEYPMPAVNDKAFDFSQPITKDITLYAHWIEVDTAVVTLKIATGTDAVATSTTITGNIGAEIKAATLTDAIKEVVDGFNPDKQDVEWYSDAAYTVKANAPTEIPQSDATYYGLVVKKAYDITYNFNGGREDQNNTARYIVKYHDGDPDWLIPQPEAPENMEFVGWQITFADGSVATPTDQDKNDMIKSASDPKFTGNLDFSAVWARTKFQAQFVDIEREDSAVTVIDTADYVPGDKIKVPADLTKTGFTFKGWTIGTNTDVATATDFVMPGNDITFVAKWEGKNVRIRFMNDTAVLAQGDWNTGDAVATPTFITSGTSIVDHTNNRIEIVEPKADDKVINKANAWTPEIGFIDGDTDFQINWINTYTVNFVYDDAVLKTVKVPEGKALKDVPETLQVLVNKEGKSASWLNGEDLFTVDTIVTENLELTPTWEDIPTPTPTDVYHITFYGPDNETPLYENDFEKNADVTFEGEDPVSEGKIFSGWATGTDAEEALKEIPKATADAKYYPVFSEHNEKYSYAVSIGAGFKMYFTIRSIPAGADFSLYTITVNGEPFTGELKLKELAEIGIMTAQELTKDYTVEIFYDGAKVGEKTYSVRSYAEAQLSKTDDQNFINLLNAMLDYGSSTQEYFIKNIAPADLANRGNYQAQMTIATATNVKTGNKPAGITGFTYQLDTLSKTEFIVMFKHDSTADMSKLTFKVNNKTVKPVDTKSGKNAVYSINLGGIDAKDLDKEFTVTVSDGTYTYKVVTRPINYMYAAANAGNAKLEKVADYLYAFHLAAKAYTGV